jgi:hypothetical protein
MECLTTNPADFTVVETLGDAEHYLTFKKLQKIMFSVSQGFHIINSEGSVIKQSNFPSFFLNATQKKWNHNSYNTTRKIVHNRIKEVLYVQLLDFMTEIAVLMYDKLSKSIFCGQWRVQIHHIPAWRSTSAGRLRAKPE